ncbi:MAG TPA: GDSL-type esterase/lipase family protein [Pirellulales bacterium]|nr:GDSL-type esterase/lipase family protein [Pirellulales bacterium]
MTIVPRPALVDFAVTSAWCWALAFGALASMFVRPASSVAAEPLAKGERIMFLGDSITEAGAGPGGYVTLIKEAIDERLAGQGIDIIGAGISGNKVPDLEARLQRDVLAKKPTRVVIYIGINDVWHSLNGRGTPKDDFEAGLRRLIGAIRKSGARVLLCTASVIGEKREGANPLDAMLDEYCEISRRVARETSSQLVDLRKAFVEHLKLHNPDDADKDVLTSDGVHLNAAGNRFVAEQMLAALNLTAPGRLLRHVVLFKFKEEVSAEQVQEVVDAFAALPGKIDTIVDFEHGTDVGVENLSAGFTHGFLVTFRDAAGRDDYLPHPAHEAFKKLVGPRIDKVLVFDYWTK